MAKKHSHSCSCEHKEVRFCKDCKVVHCLDCKQEWSNVPCTRPHYWGGYSTVYANYPSGAGQCVDLTPTVTCTSHATAGENN